MKIAGRMAEWNRRQQLIEPGDGVLVGFSGGPDSLGLLLALEEKQRELKLAFLAACHVHHGIRGAEADRDEAFCRSFCAARHIPYFSAYVDAPGAAEAAGESLETAARRLRYAELEARADTLERAYSCPVKIATAHHAGDQAETVLFHLARGTGLAGLCGIPARRGRVIRPLLTCTREEILADLAGLNQTYCVDSTNSEEAMSRNYLRLSALPVFNRLNPSFCADLTGHAEAWRADEALLTSLASDALARCRSSEGLSRKNFLQLPEALQNRTAALFLKEKNCDPTLLRIRQVKRVAACEEKAAQMGKGLVLRRAGEKLILDRGGQKTAGAFAVRISGLPMKIPKRDGFPEILIRLYPEVHKKLIENSKKPLFLSIDYDTIIGSLMLRTPGPEDRIRPLGMSGHKNVFTLLREAGETDPSGALVLADDAGVLALISPRCRRCDSRAALGSGTQRALVAEFRP